MNRPISRIFGAIELVVLIAPASTKALMGSVALVFASSIIDDLVPWIVALLLGISGIAALWRLLGAFVFVGPSAFDRVHRIWWWFSGVGGALALGSLLYMVLARSGRQIPGPMDVISIMNLVGMSGMSLLLPLAHVVIERSVRMRSNNAMQRSALVVTPLATKASGAPTARRR